MSKMLSYIIFFLVHKNLKPENIMIVVSDTGKATAKIANLGSLKQGDKENPNPCLGLKGTVGWTAPEMCDLWLKHEQRMPLQFEVRCVASYPTLAFICIKISPWHQNSKNVVSHRRELRVSQTISWHSY